ncbi:MAG: YciI family protein, partial [Silicimonas sp.]|nr:YciI family protein [Silicimonas sp.]
RLGGYYLLDCKDLDHAIEMAALIPTADHGTIELRPIMHIEFPE